MTCLNHRRKRKLKSFNGKIEGCTDLVWTECDSKSGLSFFSDMIPDDSDPFDNLDVFCKQSRSKTCEDNFSNTTIEPASLWTEPQRLSEV